MAIDERRCRLVIDVVTDAGGHEDAPAPDHGLTLGGLLIEHLRSLRLDTRSQKPPHRRRLGLRWRGGSRPMPATVTYAGIDLAVNELLAPA